MYDLVAGWCLDEPGAVEDYPFGDEAAVFKVAGKMFAILVETEPCRLTLKCDPYLAEALRERFAAVRPGYHTNKRHWNTIDLDGSVPQDELAEMVDHSYDAVVAGLTKAQRATLWCIGGEEPSERLRQDPRNPGRTNRTGPVDAGGTGRPRPRLPSRRPPHSEGPRTS